MGFLFWLRVAIMSLAFVGSVYLIREMNLPVNARRSQILSFLGSPPDPKVVIVNLCPTRITKFDLGSGIVIEQKGLTWTRGEDGRERKLDQVAVEKWFSAYCLFEGEKVTPSADVTNVLTLDYVSGPKRTLIRSRAGDFEWDGQPFRSQKMRDALVELGTLPLGPND